MKPIEPHIPEDPSEADVRALLEWLDFGICYYQQGAPAPLPDHMPTSLGGPPGQAFKLEPVMGVHWRVSRDLSTTTLYIEGKPYTVSSTWVYVNLDREKKMEAAQKRLEARHK